MDKVFGGVLRALFGLRIDFFFSSRRRHTRWNCDWSSDVCPSDLGVRAWALRSIYFEGRRRLLPEGQPAMTDDAGQYRILGLTPGSYFVMADTRETWTVVENRSEERRVGKEGRSGGSRDESKENRR